MLKHKNSYLIYTVAQPLQLVNPASSLHIWVISVDMKVETRILFIKQTKYFQPQTSITYKDKEEGRRQHPVKTIHK